MKLRAFLPDTFVIILLTAICLATVLPARGTFATLVGTTTTAGIVVLFFLHGARLARETMWQAVRHWRLHATIFTITFVIFPCLGLLSSHIAPALLPPELWLGVLFLCVLPSTVQSSIAFTSIARGNVAGTVASAAASNMFGILLTPLLVSLLTSVRHSPVSLEGIGNILLQMLVPFVLGHLSRPWTGSWVVRKKSLLAVTDRATIILAVYSAFSAAVIARIWQEVPPLMLLTLILYCTALLLVLLLLARFIARRLGFSRADEVSIVFCGSKKSLVSGIPMARVLFAGPHVGAAILPVMIFHQIQLIVCAWLARRYAADAP